MDSGYTQYRPAPAGGQRSAFSVFVGGIAFAATEDDVRQALAPAGRITGCKIVMDRETGRSKGFGFVEFESQERVDHALRELSGVQICGRPVRLDAGGKGKGGGKGGNPGAGSYNNDSRPAARYDNPSGGSYNSGGYDRNDRQQSGGYQDRQPSGGYQDRQQSGGYQDRQQTGGYQSRPQTGGYQDRQGYSDRAQPQGSSYGGQQDSSYGGQQGSSYGQQGSSYGQQPSSYGQQSSSYGKGGYGQSSRPQEAARSRSRSLSSGARERKHVERQERREKLAQSSNGWDRAPNREELAQQEAERAAVRAAEAQGKDITTIRADLLKQAQWEQNHQ